MTKRETFKVDPETHLMARFAALMEDKSIKDYLRDLVKADFEKKDLILKKKP